MISFKNKKLLAVTAIMPNASILVKIQAQCGSKQKVRGRYLKIQIKMNLNTGAGFVEVRKYRLLNLFSKEKVVCFNL